MKKLVLLSALLLSATFGMAQEETARYHHGPQGGGNGYYNNHYSPPFMSPHEFASARDMVAGRSFDSDRLTVAMQVARGNRLSASQVANLMDLFSFESTRLEFAKGAYMHVTDPHNYYVVNNAFSFSSSIDDLARHIDACSMTGQVVQTSGSYGVNAGAQGGGTVPTTTTYSTGTMTVTGGVGTVQPSPQGGNYGHNSYHHPAPMPAAICEADFNGIVHSISCQPFDRDKLIVARQAVDGRWITSSMVRRIMPLFSFESNKLEFAKYAYGNVIDRQNYYMVNDAFTFSSSIRELEGHISNFR